jgi:hypothetical protein
LGGTIKGNPGLIVLVSRRILQLQQFVKLDTQQLRTRTIEKLDKLFALATSIASGEVKWQRVGKDKQPVTPKQRQMWAHVAAHIAGIMGNLASKYDEKQFEEDLAKLELLVDAIKGESKSRQVEAECAKAAGDAEPDKASNGQGQVLHRNSTSQAV